MSQNPQKENDGKGNQSDANLFNISQGKKEVNSFVGSDYFKNLSILKNSSDSEGDKKRAKSFPKDKRLDDFKDIRRKYKDEKRNTLSSIKDKVSEPFITVSLSETIEKKLIDTFSKQLKTFRQENQ